MYTSWCICEGNEPQKIFEDMHKMFILVSVKLELEVSLFCSQVAKFSSLNIITFIVSLSGQSGSSVV